MSYSTRSIARYARFCTRSAGATRFNNTRSLATQHTLNTSLFSRVNDSDRVVSLATGSSITCPSYVLKHPSMLLCSKHTDSGASDSNRSASDCIAEGDFVEEMRIYTADDVRQFADLTGDHNGIHVDEAYAKESRFKRCIVHGMLLNGALSSLIANKLPGPGSVYIKQEIMFRAPVFVGDAFIARVEVVRVKTSRRVARIATTCLDPTEGTVLVEGEATILLPSHTTIVPRRD
eukprot:m.539137 g.539137  ORF g.539137 m.539137 type:complete len:233 (-) comp22088_c0_seq9:2413-3111(-)